MKMNFLIIEKKSQEVVDYFATREHAQDQLDKVYGSEEYEIVEAEEEEK